MHSAVQYRIQNTSSELSVLSLKLGYKFWTLQNYSTVQFQAHSLAKFHNCHPTASTFHLLTFNFSLCPPCYTDRLQLSKSRKPLLIIVDADTRESFPHSISSRITFWPTITRKQSLTPVTKNVLMGRDWSTERQSKTDTFSSAILPSGTSILVSMFKSLLLCQDYIIKFHFIVEDNSTSTSPCSVSNGLASYNLCPEGFAQTFLPWCWGQFN